MKFKLFDLELKRPFKMPFSGSGCWSKLGVGVALWVIPLLGARCAHQYIGPEFAAAALIALALPVIILTAGYCLRVAKEEAGATLDQLPQQLPTWDNWGDLFWQGIQVLALTAIYAAGFAALVLAARLVSGLPLLELSKLDKGGTANGLITVLFLMLSAVLLGSYLPCMAIHSAKKGSFKAGFEAWTILKRSFSKDNAFRDAVLGSYVLFAIAEFASLTVILCPLAVFLWLVLSANLYGQAYRIAAAAEASAREKKQNDQDGSA